jgi:hypothetical protein
VTQCRIPFHNIIVYFSPLQSFSWRQIRLYNILLLQQKQQQQQQQQLESISFNRSSLNPFGIGSDRQRQQNDKQVGQPSAASSAAAEQQKPR